MIPQIVNVVSHIVINEKIVFKLSCLQKLVCRLFKITPKKFFCYELKIKVDLPQMVLLNDILMSIDSNRWIVTNIDKEQIITIKNVHPVQYFVVAGQIILCGRVYSER